MNLADNWIFNQDGSPKHFQVHLSMQSWNILKWPFQFLDLNLNYSWEAGAARMLLYLKELEALVEEKRCTFTGGVRSLV